MDQIKYRNFFHALAENNLAIANDPEKNNRFCEVVRSFDPVSLDWDADFKSAIRSRLKLDGKCAMVLEALEWEWMDPGSSDRKIVPLASFIILKKSNSTITQAKAEEVSQCLADTQAVAEQIMAYLEEHCMRAYHEGNPLESFYLEMTGCKFLPVGPVETNWFGTRVEFNFRTPKNDVMEYNAGNWAIPL